MGKKVFCDFCKNEILNGTDLVSLNLEEHSKKYDFTHKDYHRDCFNIKFSTDVKRIKE